jgi:hypothetical protein
MVLEGSQVEIDNNRKIKYIPYCPKCYFKERNKFENNE